MLVEVLQLQRASAVKPYILGYSEGGVKNVEVILYQLRKDKNMVQLSGESDDQENGSICF